MTLQDPLAEAIGVASDDRLDIPMLWEEALDRLGLATTYWLATARPDGRPHLRPVLGVWLGSVCYAATSPASRTGRNLAVEGRCVISTGSAALPPVDLVVEGVAERVTEEIELLTVSQAYDGKYGWQVDVEDGALYGQGAPTAGPPPYHVFRISPRIAYAFPGVEGAEAPAVSDEAVVTPTRWTFP